MTGKRKAITYMVGGNGCHECMSHKPNTHGYPTLWAEGRSQNMHKVLYEESHGKLETGLVVRHKCDNRICINLDHLEPGTPKDNSQDCKKRGRLNTPRGMSRGDTKLTSAQVLEIRESMFSQRVIAKKFKINQSTVSRIKNGFRRKHLNE